MADEDIDFSDAAEVTPEMFSHAMVRKSLASVPRKEQITLRLDSKTLSWFKKQGKGYQTRINELLCAYVAVQEQHARQVAENQGKKS